jgi:hypothetical protein
MPKLRFVIAALAALFAGYLGGARSRPALLVAMPSSVPTLPALEGVAAPEIWWLPGLERNNSIVLMPGCE